MWKNNSGKIKENGRRSKITARKMIVVPGCRLITM